MEQAHSKSPQKLHILQHFTIGFINDTFNLKI